jgi:hypothetical protein
MCLGHTASSLFDDLVVMAYFHIVKKIQIH